MTSYFHWNRLAASRCFHRQLGNGALGSRPNARCLTSRFVFLNPSPERFAEFSFDNFPRPCRRLGRRVHDDCARPYRLNIAREFATAGESENKIRSRRRSRHPLRQEVLPPEDRVDSPNLACILVNNDLAASGSYPASMASRSPEASASSSWYCVYPIATSRCANSRDRRRPSRSRLFQRQLVLIAFDAVPQIDVRDLVAQHRRQLRLGLQKTKHAAQHVNLAAGKREGIDLGERIT